MTFSFNDYTWRLDPGVESERIRPILERFPRLETLPGARVIKENQLRTVVHVPAGFDRDDVASGSAMETPAAVSRAPRPTATGVISKHYRYRSMAERLRYRFRRTRAEQEWHALCRFRELGLPAAAPFAVGQLHRGTRLESEGVLLEYLAGCRPLVDAVAAAREPPDEATRGFLIPGELSPSQRALVELAAGWVRTLHDRGAWHRDLHAENLLVDPRLRKLFFIDLHSCWFQPRLARWQRRSGVLDLLYSLSFVMPPQGIDAFLDAYGRDILYGTAPWEAVRRRALRALESRERRRLRSRSKRCFVRSSMFDIAAEAGARTYHLRARSADELAALWTRNPPGRVLKRSRRGWVAEATSGGAEVCVKYRAYTWFETLRGLFGAHRLRRAYAAGHGLRVRGIETPRVIALHERRRLGWVREAYLVTELIAGAVPLDRYLMDAYYGRSAPPGRASTRKHELARDVGRFVRRLHDARVRPRDLSPQNLLVVEGTGTDASGAGDAPGLYLVDLDHVRIGGSPNLAERGRNLVQIGNLSEGHISTADLLRALRAYAGGDLRYWNRKWIDDLRRSLLDEHLRVVLRRSLRFQSSSKYSTTYRRMSPD